MIHKATQKQKKDVYHLVKDKQQTVMKMETNLEEIETIFTDLGFKIQDNPDGMMYAGFNWKLDWSNSNHSFIFDILYSDERFEIFITNQDLVPHGEEQHYFSDKHPKLHLKKMTDWVGIEELKKLLTDLVTVFLKEY